jgi:ribonuclease P protein component
VQITKDTQDETNFSAPQHTSQADTRIPYPHEDQKRSQSHQCPPRKRTEAIGRIKHFERIRDSRGFDAVYKRADTTWHTPYFVLFFRKGTSMHRVGFVAGKKVGNAVKRNRAKRLLRALFLTHADLLPSGQYVLVAKQALVTHEGFSEIARAFALALKRAGAYPKGAIPDNTQTAQLNSPPLSKTSV